ncbi:MAG: hypothetical protein MHM6MM_009670 [Cercozoa sp. M6MM]
MHVCDREKQLRDCGIPNFFAPHRKQLHEVLRVVQCVCRKRRVSEIQDETGLGKDFIRSVKKHVFQVMYMAEVAREKQKKMSGLTEVDEMGVGQPKFHIGHRGRLAGTMWVLTFTEVSETTRDNGTKKREVEEVRWTLVPKRDSDTIGRHVRQHIEPKTIIQTDKWRAYSESTSLVGMQHYQCNHSSIRYSIFY